MTGNAGRTIAIVGAGYAGTVVAINLLRTAVRPTHILLIERSGTFVTSIQSRLPSACCRGSIM